MLSGLGDEHHVTLHVSSSLVVLAVGDLPREVWDKKCRVTNPSSGIVENLRWRERLAISLATYPNPLTPDRSKQCLGMAFRISLTV